MDMESDGHCHEISGAITVVRAVCKKKEKSGRSFCKKAVFLKKRLFLDHF